MFGNEDVVATGRYRMEIVTGEMRTKSHQRKVQEALNEGGNRGWELVSATTTNATGAFVTSLYWDTSPRH
jgi:hypothetical protein